MRGILNKIAGLDEGYWANSESDDLKCRWHVAVVGGPDYALPRREMEIEEVVEWAASRYEAFGKRLAALTPDGAVVDWETTVGIIEAVLPSDAGAAGGIISHVRDRYSGITVKLHQPFPLEELTDVWEFRNNFHLDSAQLHNTETDACIPFEAMFLKAPAASLVAPSMS